MFVSVGTLVQYLGFFRCIISRFVDETQRVFGNRLIKHRKQMIVDR